MKVGFTGTRRGMTDTQLEQFLLTCEHLQVTELHHGCCKGADADAGLGIKQAMGAAVRVHAHPGKSARRGHNEMLDQPALLAADVVHETKTHFARNRDIVEQTEALIATPKEDCPQTNGGTWYTVDYAARASKPTYIIYPIGRVQTCNVEASNG